jgi:hypothetical protein
MSLSKPEAAPSAWCYVFTKFGNAGAGPASLCGEDPSATFYLDGTVIKSCLARGSKLGRNFT